MISSQTYINSKINFEDYTCTNISYYKLQKLTSRVANSFTLFRFEYASGMICQSMRLVVSKILFTNNLCCRINLTTQSVQFYELQLVYTIKRYTVLISIAHSYLWKRLQLALITHSTYMPLARLQRLRFSAHN